MRGVPNGSDRSCSNLKKTTAWRSDRFANAARSLNCCQLDDGEDMCQRKIAVTN